jgi:hypothetical protein
MYNSKGNKTKQKPLQIQYLKSISNIRNFVCPSFVSIIGSAVNHVEAFALTTPHKHIKKSNSSKN